MFIAVTTIKLPADQLEHVASAFRRTAPDLKQFAGFLGLELWRSGDTLKAVSRWESQRAMEAYAQSGIFQAHHGPEARAQSQGAGQAESYECELVV
jgi:heme-degrading monooxygenase HmoA